MTHISVIMKTVLAPFFPVIVCLVVLGCSQSKLGGTGEPGVLQVEGDYVHAGTGFTYPVSIDGHTRGRVVQYDRRGDDVSAGYDVLDPEKPMAITVYVYPAPEVKSVGSPENVVAAARANVSKSWYRNEKQEILGTHPSAALFQESKYTMERDGVTYTADWAVFEFDDDVNGVAVSKRSHLVLFRYVGDAWGIKFRITHPNNFDGTDEIQSFLAELPWTLSEGVAFQTTFEE